MPDIISSVKVPQLIKDPFLVGSKIQFAPSGMPIMYVGGFSMVFPMIKGNEMWAMKVWHTEIKDAKERYKEISNFLNGKCTDYFANFSYVEKGLIVNGQALDTSRMRWIEGKLLKDFLKDNLEKKEKLVEFTDKFLALSIALHEQSISHGDLQHGNIIVQADGEIKLVDYDSICIPSMEGKSEYVTGLKGYQHPSRFSNSICSIKADYFSELIIYLSVLALSEHPELWIKYNVNDTEVLLFSQEDFNDFERSEIREDLLKLSPKINALVNVLDGYLIEKAFTNLIPFSKYLQPPSIISFKADRVTAIGGIPILLTWQIDNAHTIAIDNGIGIVTGKNQIKVRPDRNVSYTITATGYFGQVSDCIDITVFPTPFIESLKVPSPDFNMGLNLNPISISSPQIDVSIKLEKDELTEIPTSFIKLNEDIEKVKPLYKPEETFWNISNVFDKIKKSLNQ